MKIKKTALEPRPGELNRTVSRKQRVGCYSLAVDEKNTNEKFRLTYEKGDPMHHLATKKASKTVISLLILDQHKKMFEIFYI
jgi:hypothetical protein